LERPQAFALVVLEADKPVRQQTKIRDSGHHGVDVAAGAARKGVLAAGERALARRAS
jgi:hypothetical protein